MAGYSGTPLVQKLGIKPGARVIFLNPPPEFETTLGPLPEGTLKLRRLTAPVDTAIVFSDSRKELDRLFARASRALARNGSLWVGWPKRASGVQTDLTEDVVRSVGLPRGLVDVKVCAIDEIWSGLKFVIRKENR